MAAAAQTEAKADPLHRLQTTFGGVPCGQIIADWYLWELVLNDRADLVAIVEFGTWEGGFSRYLSCQASMRGIDFVTYDSTVPANPPYEFERRDILIADAEQTRLELASYAAPIILLVDNGNKPREAADYAPVLPARSLLVVHDWLTEFLPDDIPAGVVEVYGDACDALGSMSRVFLIDEAA